MDDHTSQPGADSASAVEEEVAPPRMHKVLLHNDHYTTMEFVVYVLQGIFNKSIEDATRIMLNVHQAGVGVAGVYSRDIAETKVSTVHSLAQDHGYPLRCSTEPE